MALDLRVGLPHLEAVVRPGREHHGAVLLVEREVLDVDGARRAEDHHREPRHVPVVRHDHVRADRRLVRRHVRADNLRDTNKRKSWFRTQKLNLYSLEIVFPLLA